LDDLLLVILAEVKNKFKDFAGGSWSICLIIGVFFEAIIDKKTKTTKVVFNTLQVVQFV